MGHELVFNLRNNIQQAGFNNSKGNSCIRRHKLHATIQILFYLCR